MKRFAAAQLQHNFDPTQVLYLTGDINYCTVHLFSGEEILSSRTLKWYNNRWPHFIRIHKGYLINPQYVHRCVLISTIVARVIMRNGASLSIGRRRIPDIVNQLDNFLPAVYRQWVEPPTGRAVGPGLKLVQWEAINR